MTEGRRGYNVLTVLGHSQPTKKSEEKLEQKLEVETMGEDFLLAFSQAHASLAFLYSGGSPAQGMELSTVDWVFLHQLIIQTIFTDQPTGQSSLGNPSAETPQATLDFV